jgi:hypothetical protein
MDVSLNGKMSGFRKWAEIHEPKKIVETRIAANEGVAAAADDHQGGKTPDLQPHRPWLVPGVGRL